MSFRAKSNLDHPIAGFMFRNHLGVDFAGTNTAREDSPLPPMAAGDLCTVDFHLDLPALYPSSFSFSPAIANGSLEHYAICDWIDNAVALQMDPSEGPIYGQFHFPCRVEVNAKMSRAGVPVAVSEFTGERVIPGQVNDDLWAEHIARYAFASRLAGGARVLDIGCGTGYGTAELAQEAQSATGIDLSSEAIAYAREHYPLPNTTFLEASATSVPLPHASLDLITAFEVIEHLDNWHDFLIEVAAPAPSERDVFGLDAEQAVLRGIAGEGRSESIPYPRIRV